MRIRKVPPGAKAVRRAFDGQGDDWESLRDLSACQIVQLADALQNSLDAIQAAARSGDDAVASQLEPTRDELECRVEWIEAHLSFIPMTSAEDVRARTEFMIRRAIARGEDLGTIAIVAAIGRDQSMQLGEVSCR